LWSPPLTLGTEKEHANALRLVKQGDGAVGTEVPSKAIVIRVVNTGDPKPVPFTVTFVSYGPLAGEREIVATSA